MSFCNYIGDNSYMTKLLIASTRLISVAAMAIASSTPVLAELKTGQTVYRSTCMECHDTGLLQAPKLGDVRAWKPLIDEGQDVLSAHAFIGVRAMPAQGGDSKLSLEEFSRTVAWMARSAGANWQDPDDAMMKKIRHEAEERLDEEIHEKKKLKAALKRKD